MTAHLNCGCGTAMEADPDRPVGTRSCPTCGRPFPAPSPSKRRRAWFWLGLASVTAAGLAGALLTAVENAREAAVLAH